MSHQLDDGERAKYWNEDYLRYWKARVDDANQGETGEPHGAGGDRRASPDQVYLDTIRGLELSRADAVLEVACGFGRSLNTLCRLARHVTAVDISRQMIEAARASCVESNITLHVCPGERMPFAAGSFDAVICFAAFDAMYQAEALSEMNRVCRVGGKVLLTGKNDDYHDDDLPALAAEVGARAKHHPNYFTDVGLLFAHLGEFGFRVTAERYHARRGDLSAGVFEQTRPERFYEYLIVLEKIAEATIADGFAISRAVSKTHTRRALSPETGG